MSRAMGLDIGTKTIGIAFSGPTYLIAQAHSTLKRTQLSQDLAAVERLIQEQDVRDIVIGLP